MNATLMNLNGLVAATLHALDGLSGLVLPSEYVFLPPICLAIALVMSAAHRDDMRQILRHALRSWATLVAGILVFMFAASYLLEWILPS